MVMAVEEEFGVELTDDGLEVVKTIEQLAAAIDRLIKKD
jgi:acyl carrier protein